MARAAPVATMSFPQYLAFEAAAATKHEFLDGRVYAMSGGTPEHAALAAAVIIQLGTALRGRPCRVFSADLRIHSKATGLTTYADAAVVCGALETSAEDDLACTNPTLLVEVLSESTEAYDRGAKASHYRRIASLREFVLVTQSEPLVEVYRKNDRGLWELAVEARSGTVELASVDAGLDLATLYANPLS